MFGVVSSIINGLFASAYENGRTLDSPLDFRVKSAVSWIDSSRLISPKSTRQGYVVRFGKSIEFCSSVTLEKTRKSTSTVTWLKWCVWRGKSWKIFRTRMKLLMGRWRLSWLILFLLIPATYTWVKLIIFICMIYKACASKPSWLPH